MEGRGPLPPAHGERGRRTSAHTATRRGCCRLRRTQNPPSLPAPPPLARVPGCLAQAEWTERELSQASALASQCPRQPRAPGVPGCRGSPRHQNHPSRCRPVLPVHTQFPGPQACCPERPPHGSPGSAGAEARQGTSPARHLSTKDPTPRALAASSAPGAAWGGDGAQGSAGRGPVSTGRPAGEQKLS